MRALEAPRQQTEVRTYSLQHPYLPMAFTFAQRRSYAEHLIRAGATSSDGQTSGNDGSDPADNEGFDFINDD